MFGYVWPFDGLAFKSIEWYGTPFFCSRHDIYVTFSVAEFKVNARRVYCDRTNIVRYIKLVLPASRLVLPLLREQHYLIEFTTVAGIRDIHDIY